MLDTYPVKPKREARLSQQRLYHHWAVPFNLIHIFPSYLYFSQYCLSVGSVPFSSQTIISVLQPTVTPASHVFTASSPQLSSHCGGPFGSLVITKAHGASQCLLCNNPGNASISQASNPNSTGNVHVKLPSGDPPSSTMLARLKHL